MIRDSTHTIFNNSNMYRYNVFIDSFGIPDRKTISILRIYTQLNANYIRDVQFPNCPGILYIYMTV